jgi:hypothetical protein
MVLFDVIYKCKYFIVLLPDVATRSSSVAGSLLFGRPSCRGRSNVQTVWTSPPESKLKRCDARFVEVALFVLRSYNIQFNAENMGKC